jgi:hypothetical protein
MSRQAVLVRGSGDVGAAVAIVLHRAGFGVAIDEVAAPAAARRGMAFADAVFVGVGSSQLGVGTRSPGVGELRSSPSSRSVAATDAEIFRILRQHPNQRRFL